MDVLSGTRFIGIMNQACLEICRGFRSWKESDTGAHFSCFALVHDNYLLFIEFSCFSIGLDAPNSFLVEATENCGLPLILPRPGHDSSSSRSRGVTGWQSLRSSWARSAGGCVLRCHGYGSKFVGGMYILHGWIDMNSFDPCDELCLAVGISD